jgi:hypothetical protein
MLERQAERDAKVLEMISKDKTDDVVNNKTDAQEDEKCNAISGIKYDQTIPPLKDTDFSFDDHYEEFMSIVNGQAYGRKAVRPYDVLNLYKKALPLGSTRLKMYDLMIKQARRNGRIPNEAKEVMEEIRVALRQIIRESALAKEERLEAEFNKLTMTNGMAHSAFRVEFQRQVLEMLQADLYIAHHPHSLFRKYLCKISPELRSIVMKGTWELDGEGSLLRKPVTWEEVATCVEIELVARADVKAQTDYVHHFDEISPAGEVTTVSLEEIRPIP